MAMQMVILMAPALDDDLGFEEVVEDPPGSTPVA